jgi:hypothetical protein
LNHGEDEMLDFVREAKIWRVGSRSVGVIRVGLGIRGFLVLRRLLQMMELVVSEVKTSLNLPLSTLEKYLLSSPSL